MSETPPPYDPQNLQRTAFHDQRQAALREAAAMTAAHYQMLKDANLPVHLIERLTEQFQEIYIATLLGVELIELDGSEQ